MKLNFSYEEATFSTLKQERLIFDYLAKIYRWPITWRKLSQDEQEEWVFRLRNAYQAFKLHHSWPGLFQLMEARDQSIFLWLNASDSTTPRRLMERYL
jgi:hypothetical protein